MLNATLWGIYAFVLQEFWVGAPGLVNAPLCIITIIIVTKARKKYPLIGPLEEAPKVTNKTFPDPLTRDYHQG